MGLVNNNLCYQNKQLMMITENSLKLYNKVPCSIFLAFVAFAFAQCTKAEVDTSQVRPAPRHASEMTDESDGDNGEPVGLTCVFPVGGGATSDALMAEFLAQRTAQQPKVLIIPHAYAGTPSSMESQLTRFTNQFRDLGVQNVEGLNLSSGQGALDQINSADVIWISGGLQNTLRNTLNNADTRLIPAIRNRYNRGLAVVGGTSAGAAVVSQVMIGGDGGNSASNPGNVSISTGFGLWPEIIVDQHFTERNRMWRLQNAISRNPNLIGVGIDESTGILYINKTEFRVIGSGTVTVLTQQDGEQQVTVLHPGDVYQLAGN